MTKLPYNTEDLAIKLASMPDGLYRLSMDVANPCRDKRRTRRSGIEAGPEKFLAGEEWLLRRENGLRSVLPSAKWTDIAICRRDGRQATKLWFALADDDGTPENVPYARGCEDETEVMVSIAVLDALVPVARSFDTVFAAAKSRGGWDVVKALLDAGKVTLEDIEAADMAVQKADT